MATEQNLQLAAQAWCKQKTQHIVMQPELAEEFANILDKQIAELERKLAEQQAILERIAFTGMDCSMSGDKEYFYRTQLRNCISMAANCSHEELNKLLVAAKEEAVVNFIRGEINRDYSSYLNQEFAQLLPEYFSRLLGSLDVAAPKPQGETK